MTRPLSAYDSAMQATVTIIDPLSGLEQSTTLREAIARSPTLIENGTTDNLNRHGKLEPFFARLTTIWEKAKEALECLSENESSTMQDLQDKITALEEAVIYR